MAQDGIVLTEAQLQVLEKRRNEKEAHGEIETQHPGYLGCQDTYYNTDDSTATLKQLNGIQADAIQDLRRKELQLQEELKKKEQELEDSQSNSSNTSDNSHSSSNTGPRTTRGDNVSPEP
ncbi:hypothetical protein J6590_087300, partial [Homalodisca vitripennis]